MDKIRTMISHSPEDTVDIASRIAGYLEPGDFIGLVGDLGAGKTMFVKGLARGMGVEEYKYVNSPSFVVLKEYHGKKILYHFDVYRLDEKGFCETLDYERYFYDSGVTVVEWADKIRDILPEEYLEIRIDPVGQAERRFSFAPTGKRFSDIVAEIG